MAMALNTALENIERTMPSIAFSDSWKFIKDHLSAQAKVRVTYEDVERMCQAFYENKGSMKWGKLMECWKENYRSNMRADLESFAARLSQGAQGEAVSVITIDDEGCAKWSVSAGDLSPGKYWLYTHPRHRDDVPDGVVAWRYRIGGREKHLNPWVYQTAGEELVERLPIIEAQPLYTHPAERAAVPDGWVLVPIEPTEDMLAQACTHDVQPRTEKVDQWNRDTWAFMLTAAPQPIEGARVVDGWQPIESAPTDGTLHVRGLWVRTPRGSYFDAVVGGINDEGEFVDMDHDSTRWDASDYTHWHHLSAAPTLAGKEG